MDEKMYKANLKLVDENKMLKQDIVTLIKYLKADYDTKLNLKEEVENLIKKYWRYCK